MRTVFPMYGIRGRMDLPWKITKSGRIAVFAPTSWENEWLWMYCNPKTGWVPLPGKAHK